MDVGRVAAVIRYPLRSAGGEVLDRVDVGPEGLEDDRRWVLVDDAGTAVTAREAPGLRGVGVRAAAGRLVLDLPGPPDPHEPSSAQVALSAVVGRAVRLRDGGPAGGPDRTAPAAAAVHLVSAGAATATDAPAGCDPEPRANLVLDLGPAPGGERGWVGRRLRVGQGEAAVVLRVTRTPKRCLGVYAEVDRPGRLAVGDPVALLDD